MLANPLFSVQACPVCSLTLHVPAQLLGAPAACPHCRARFIAGHADKPLTASSHQCQSLIERADALLAHQCGR